MSGLKKCLVITVTIATAEGVFLNDKNKVFDAKTKSFFV